MRPAEFDVVEFFPRSRPVGLRVYSVLRRYCVDQTTDLSRVSFRHIAQFLDTGLETARLEIAGGHCGYTLLDLRELRCIGAKGVVVAREIVSRGPGHPGPQGRPWTMGPRRHGRHDGRGRRGRQADPAPGEE